MNVLGNDDYEIGELLRQLVDSKQPDADFFSEADTLHEIFMELKNAIASTLARSFNGFLERLYSAAPPVQHDLAKRANSILRELSLAIKCPKTGMPATIVADSVGHDAQQTRVRLAMKNSATYAAGRVTIDKSTLRLELMGVSPRIEPLSRDEGLNRRGR